MVMVETRAAVAGELKKAWGWLLAWGIILLIAGVVALGYEFSVSVVTTLFVGGLLVVYGVIEVVHRSGRASSSSSSAASSPSSPAPSSWRDRSPAWRS
jgi:uncharacterized membrane protein HdeD (DUF308 family)